MSKREYSKPFFRHMPDIRVTLTDCDVSDRDERNGVNYGWLLVRVPEVADTNDEFNGYYNTREGLLQAIRKVYYGSDDERYDDFFVQAILNNTRSVAIAKDLKRLPNPLFHHLKKLGQR